MIYLYGPGGDRINKKSAVCVGKFDGLHRGHRLLLDQVKELKAQGYVSLALSFLESPRRLLLGERYNIVDREEREYLFEESGIDYLAQWDFNEKLMHMSPEGFLLHLKEELGMEILVVGEDFRFGYRGQGDANLLRTLGEKLGFRPIILPKLQEGGEDVSSTRIRSLLEKGEMEEANDLLGYPFFALGEVIYGKQIGRTIGIPTINQAVAEDKLLPRFGVYVTHTVIDGKPYWGMTNVGVKPSIAGVHAPGIETFLVGFTGNLYGRRIKVDFLHFVRDEVKFDSIEALKAQIDEDKRSIGEFIKEREELLSV